MNSLQFVIEVTLLILVLLDEGTDFLVLDVKQVLKLIEFTFENVQFTFV